MRVMLAEAGVRGDGDNDGDSDNESEIRPSTQKSHAIWSP